ncbi:endonuclease/exonuclease/phosphatase family protein [Aromatoleum petrolei]|uniref:Endonuclease/exonuclease/phosphatase domain-containing protein n=1 Tax=Aromatoleum petrolei TaxID=76116 RepID=A0ABX1MVM0_9RHOO|nr:endonuclease/exonuclease/phosphatase family protein [Aromatoleum petrolei]NMF90721.1 hypothetical protein [Aromatoleum petrolei]
MAFSLVGALTPLTTGLPESHSTLAWLLDLASHWQWVYLVFGGVCATWLLAIGSYAWALSGLSALALGWGFASPETYAVVPRPQQSLTVVTANLHGENPSPLHGWAESLGADVVVMQEVTPSVAGEFGRWERFPHRVVHVQEGPFGLAVLSRHPLALSEVREAHGQTPHIRTRVRIGAIEVALSALHPMPPVNSHYHVLRAALFESEASWAVGTMLPAIIAGDLNATPWSTAMHPFAAHGLRRATGLEPTWPALLPAIPIDQVVVSPHWRVVDRGVGPRMGSDHRPVYVVLGLPSTVPNEAEALTNSTEEP